MAKSKTKNYRESKKTMARSQQRGDRTLRRLKEDLAVASRDAVRLVKANDTLQAQVTAAQADAAEARAGRDESQVLLTRAFREHDAAAHERDDFRRKLESVQGAIDANLQASAKRELSAITLMNRLIAERDAIIVQRDELARRVQDLENVVDVAGV